MIDSKVFKNGDTLHCWRNSFISTQIQRVLRSKLAHSAKFIELYGDAYIIESQAEGARPIPFDKWIEKYNYSFVVTRDPNNIVDPKQFKRIALSFSGTKYGFFDLARHYFYKKTRIWVGVRRESKKMICSELIMKIYDNFYDIPEDYYKMTPKDVYEWELSQGFEVIEYKE